MTHFYNPPRKSQEISRKNILTVNEPNELELALSSPDFRQVRLLKMKNSNITDETTKCLLKVDFELQVEKIDISENFSFVTDDTLITLAQCKALHRLGSINLADNNITDEGVRIMSDSGVFSRLRELVLYGNSGITNESLLALAASEWIKGLQQLDLHATFIGDVGVGTFLESDNSSCLEFLDLSMSWDRISDRTLESLSRSKFCCKLVKLNLEDCNVSDIGASMLFHSENSIVLQQLNLSNSIDKQNNRISDLSLKELALSKTVKNLKRLYLKSTNVSSDGIKAFASSQPFEQLQVLKLSHCREIDENALQYLGQMLLYSNLSKLHINSTSVPRAEAVKFEQKFPQVNTIY